MKTLRQALAYVREIRVQSIEKSITDEHKFSAIFIRKMDKLIKRERMAIYPLINTQLKRVVAIIVIAVIVSLSAIFSVPALRSRVYEMIQDIYEKYSMISFRYASDVDAKQQPFVEYSLGYIPEGFERVDGASHPEDHLKYAVYYYEGAYIRFRQQSVADSNFMVNTENVDLKSMYIGDREIYYIDTGSSKVLFWYEDTYVFTIAGQIEDDQVFDIIKNVTNE